MFAVIKTIWMITNNSSTNGFSLPPQMIPLSKKNKGGKKWWKDNMDTLEMIGRRQISTYGELVENYQMLKGKFIFKHYIEDDDYKDLVSKLSEEFKVPSYLKHYDIIASVVNTLSGEYQKRPDILKVRDLSEKSRNNYSREKKKLMMQWLEINLNSYITKSLMEEGLDPEKDDFKSQEEQQQYQEYVNGRIQALTPPEIQRYMDMDWMDASEIWGEHQKAHDDERFNRKETSRILFEDMLAADRAFKHFYLVPNGYEEEIWNPVNTFYHKSPEIRYIEHGDYVGRKLYMSKGELINRYGYKLTEKDLLKLEVHKLDSYNKGKTPGTSTGWGGGSGNGSPRIGSNVAPGTMMPFADYAQHDFINSFKPSHDLFNSEDSISMALGEYEDGDYLNVRNGDTFEVTEAYWMSQEKRGKYVYQDSETGQTRVVIVDETFRHDLIPNVVIIDDSFLEFGTEDKINTLTWTWVNVCYKGIKINNRSLGWEEGIYIDLIPNEFQFKGDANIYGSKLPVCGQIFNDRNGDSTPLVNLMKPHQIGHNIAMNQLYELQQREIGRFLLMDATVIPSTKDWGGEGNWERFMMIAKNAGIGVVDGSNANTHNSNFSHFQVIDLDESARMMSRIRIADYFEQRALSQVGITPQRLGSVAASETATGVETATSQSFAQTESYFSRFSDFEKRCLQMSLDIAQYVQSNQENITIMNIKSDISRSYIEITGSDLLNAELGLYVVDSQEVIRQLETIRQLFLQNNTTGATPPDLATVIFSNSPAEIKAQLETSYRLQQEREQAAQEEASRQHSEQLESDQTIAAEKERKLDERFDKKLANDRYIAEVKAISSANFGQGMDTDESGIPDVLEIQKHNAEINKTSEDILFKNTAETNRANDQNYKNSLKLKELELENKQLDNDSRLKEKELGLKEKEIDQQLDVARYYDKGTANSPTIKKKD